jgi:hypothetical protein
MEHLQKSEDCNSSQKWRIFNAIKKAKRRLIRQQKAAFPGAVPRTIHLSGSPRKKQEPIGGKVMQARTPSSLSKKSAFCPFIIVYSGIPSAST